LGYSKPDPYYNPDKFDLEILGVLDLCYESYSFHDLVVWRHLETGQIYWAEDSGCSCPSPFEDLTSMDQLNTLDSWRDLAVLLNDRLGDAYDEAHWRYSATESDWNNMKADSAALIAKVREGFRNVK
jgi:hypothetical protein